MSKSVWPTLQEIADLVNAKEVSAKSNVDKALKIINKNQEYHAILQVIEKRPYDLAEQIDQKVSLGQNAGRLAGVPFIAKDNFLTFGSYTTAASNILKGFEAPYQATAIELLEAEGAICVAKANLDAFAHGSSTENSDFFTTLNPNDKELVPGGSSGGSAAAVMLNMTPFALGTDTGGSIRLPASFCGAVGYKPTYGLVSRNGVVAMASSTDVIGPITNSVADAALVLDIIAKKDSLDSTTIERDESSYTITESTNKKTVGIIKEFTEEGADMNVENSIDSAIEAIVKAGYKTKIISIPSIKYALACYYIICPAEVSSNLSRYDGQKFGYSYPEATNLDESYELSRSKGFGKEAKRRIMIGTHVLSSGYYDAYYKKAQTVRTKLIDEFDRSFKEVDYMIGPTSPVTAFKIGDKIKDPLAMYLIDIMTVSANLVGIPAISIPAKKANNMPVGLQIMANRRQDKNLLSFAHNIEGVIK